jgi:hypothetical protein
MEGQRDKPIRMQCVCRLRINEYAHDSCAIITSGPDEPVCEFCAKAQHPKMDTFDPIVKGGDHAGARVPGVRLP